MPLQVVGHYDTQSIRKLREKARQKELGAPLFLFGDNLARTGRAGQAAAVRGLPEAMGIPTKVEPRIPIRRDNWPECRDRFLSEWDRTADAVCQALDGNRLVCWPAAGIGTGLAMLPEKAPDAWRELCLRTRRIFAHDLALPESRSGRAEKSLAIITCGGRDYEDQEAVSLCLDAVQRHRRLVLLVEGAARGADRLAGRWAEKAGIGHLAVPADWKGQGRKAGFVRNREMLSRLLEIREQTGWTIGVLAFPGGAGTAMMCHIARDAGVDVLEAQVLIERLRRPDARKSPAESPLPPA